MTYEAIFQVDDKDIIREGLSKYTRKAFQVLPKIDKLGSDVNSRHQTSHAATSPA